MVHVMGGWGDGTCDGMIIITISEVIRKGKNGSEWYECICTTQTHRTLEGGGVTGTCY